MKYLAVALILCTQLHLLHGACSNNLLKEDATECEDPVDRTMHPIGSHWRNSACQDCTCWECCDAFSTPVNFPDDCIKEFDKTECKYKVYKKDDPTQSCPIFGSVG